MESLKDRTFLFPYQCSENENKAKFIHMIHLTLQYQAEDMARSENKAKIIHVILLTLQYQRIWMRVRIEQGSYL